MLEEKNECKEYVDEIINEINEEYENGDIFEWVSNQLSIERYILDSNKELCGVEILITCGGPDCRLNTDDSSVTCVWGSDRFTGWIDSGISEEINELFYDEF